MKQFVFPSRTLCSLAALLSFSLPVHMGAQSPSDPLQPDGFPLAFHTGQALETTVPAFAQPVRGMASRLALPSSVGSAIAPAATTPNGIVYTCDPNMNGSICATLNTTIASLYSKNFTNANASIYIRFGGASFGQSVYTTVPLSYSTFRTALQGGSTSANDTLAINSSVPATNPFPGRTLSLTNANARALGVTVRSGLQADSETSCTLGVSGCYDGVITISSSLNSSGQLYFRTGAPIGANQYDVYSAIEHEADEILGTASCAFNCLGTITPVDLFRYHSDGTRSFGAGSNDTCSSPSATNACFSLDGVHMLQQYNNLNNGLDSGDWLTSCSSPLVQDAAICSAKANVDISPQAEIKVLDVIGYVPSGAPQAPTASTSAASAVTSTTATLSGSVTPNGNDTHVWFEYSTSSSLAASTLTPQQDIGAGTTAATVSANLAGLGGGTTYYFRVWASSSVGNSSGATLSFATAAAPQVPTLSAVTVTGLATSSVVLSASVTPNGSDTHFWLTVATDSSMNGVISTAQGDSTAGSISSQFNSTITGLASNTTYYFQARATNSVGTSQGPVGIFTTPSATLTGVAGLEFYPVTPCRVVDTRNGAGFSGAFGPPSFTAGATRTFPISSGSCGIPANAAAYSLNITVVTKGYLGYLSVWPSGQAMPGVSTLNSYANFSTAVSNAAIVPAGNSGSIDVYATDATDVIIDINGYFAPQTDGYVFYPVTPCRLVDTRVASFQAGFGPPSLAAGGTRTFSVPANGACQIPSTAQAYSVNLTAVPQKTLGLLSIWPAGKPLPNVSTLNVYSPGTVVANAAIVPAGNGGAISTYASDSTDLVIDINGYFAPASANTGLKFYPATPCRVADTRVSSFPVLLGPPVMSAGAQRSFAVPQSTCGIPANAGAYSLNFTAVPHASQLGIFAAWPTGQAQPNVSTMNSYNGSVVANAAIVPAGTNGAISIYVTDPSDILFDINGYFAP